MKSGWYVAFVLFVAGLLAPSRADKGQEHWQYGHWYGKRDPSDVNNAQIDDVLRSHPELQQLLNKLMELPRRPKASSQMYTKYDDDYPDGDVSDSTKRVLEEPGSPYWKRVAEEMVREGWLLRGHPSMRKKRAAERDPIWRPW
ncbi:uncharacterized protein LOC118412225 [Branchiostoma floridae]|uniref:Uncharacterized protein LOC118412225 n=1 Tax=Branchiostoma floridae TaxID=7739 RepID=C3YKH4_BRAFL|nr:uncharacterized protein LOC118412225 [Branchiostoma floridae]|eukprot:XP_002603207.1 hypothetical protein BRAFLDRAFT_93391 [Branchiostoma floridae]